MDFHMAMELEDGQTEIYTKGSTKLDIKMELVHLFQLSRDGSIWETGQLV